jgi:hypothetical protein
MESIISVPVKTEKFLELCDFLRETGDPRDPVSMVNTAIEYWLDNAEWKPELRGTTDLKGYTWKRLFLPHGTQVRMQYKGRYYYARVEGDDLLYEGAPTSPGNLANTITHSSRNAWRDLWIKRPDDKEWRLADDCRDEHEKMVRGLEQELAKR